MVPSDSPLGSVFDLVDEVINPFSSYVRDSYWVGEEILSSINFPSELSFLKDNISLPSCFVINLFPSSSIYSE